MQRAAERRSIVEATSLPIPRSLDRVATRAFGARPTRNPTHINRLPPGDTPHRHNIIFKNRKKKDVGNQILDATDALPEDVDRLLRINIMSLTDEMVKELEKEIKVAQKELKYWTKETPKTQFEKDLDEL